MATFRWQVSGLDSRDVPWRWHSDYKQDSPGDDSLSFTLAPPKRTALFAVVCADDSNYTLGLSMADSLVPLVNGFPKRLEVPAGESRYFVAHVPGAARLNVSVTPLSGDPDLYISTTEQRPYLQTSQWNSTAASGRYDASARTPLHSASSQRCSRRQV